MQFQFKPINYFSYQKLMLFALILFTLQLLSGTSLFFALCIFVYLICFGLAFNLLGGLATVNGFCLTMLASKTIIISQIAKILLWQPASENLPVADTTVLVLAVGMFSTLLGAALYYQMRKMFHFKQIQMIIPDSRKFAYLCFVIGVFSTAIVRLGNEGTAIPPILIGICTYLQSLMILAIAASIAHTIQHSNGVRFMSARTIFMVLSQFMWGVLGATKSGMFEPIVTCLLTCFIFQYRFKFSHIVSIMLIGVFAAKLLVPLSDFGRYIFKTGSIVETVPKLVEFISEYMGSFEKIKELNEIEIESIKESAGSEMLYYGKPAPVLERMSLITAASRLIRATLQKGDEGVSFFIYHLPLLPRSFTDNFMKKGDNPGNYFGHKTELLNDEDKTTAVSFGMFAEAFGISSWMGISIYPCFFLFIFFFTNDFLGGISSNPIWATFLMMTLQHTIAEAGIMWLAFHTFRMFPFLFLLQRALCALDGLISAPAVRSRLKVVEE